MTRLLLCTVLLGNLASSATAQEFVTPPGQVRFDSVDYRNTLHWTPPPNSSSLEYNVQWKIYGERDWLDVDSCQRVQKLQCDLSSVTSDTREWYYARVCASSGPSSSKSAWALSSRFSPRWNTKISPPTLKLHLNKQNVVVQAKSPRVLVRKMQSSLHYKIYLIQTGREEEEFRMDCCSSKLTLAELKHKTRYCLQAQTFIPLQAKISARSNVSCITTP